MIRAKHGPPISLLTMTQELTDEPAGTSVDPPDDRLTATKETLEDYTLRFAPPRSYRKWSTRVVGISALGGIATWPTSPSAPISASPTAPRTRCGGIFIFAVVVMLTGFPVAYYSARYNIDLDLVTRGSGFGYYGSVVTNVIFATFTFIFFALEARSWPRASNSGWASPPVAGLRGLHAHHLPAGHLRHESAVHTAGVDHPPTVVDPDGGAVRLPGDQPPGIGRPVLRLPG